MSLIGLVVSEKKNFEILPYAYIVTLACDLDDMTKPYVNSEGLCPGIIVAKYEPNRPSGFREEEL